MTQHVVRTMYSIDEFCEQIGVSRSTFYNMEKRNDAPLTVKVGRLKMISIMALREWFRGKGIDFDEGGAGAVRVKINSVPSSRNFVWEGGLKVLPRIGEYIRLNGDAQAFEVMRVFHNLDDGDYFLIVK